MREVLSLALVVLHAGCADTGRDEVRVPLYLAGSAVSEPFPAVGGVHVTLERAELAFGPGLNAITGETGAGKTILAQAIGLLLGAPGDAGYLGPEAAEAYVEAELDLPDGLLEEEEDLAAIARRARRGTRP